MYRALSKIQVLQGFLKLKLCELEFLLCNFSLLILQRRKCFESAFRLTLMNCTLQQYERQTNISSSYKRNTICLWWSKYLSYWNHWFIQFKTKVDFLHSLEYQVLGISLQSTHDVILNKLHVLLFLLYSFYLLKL